MLEYYCGSSFTASQSYSVVPLHIVSNFTQHKRGSHLETFFPLIFSDRQPITTIHQDNKDVNYKMVKQTKNFACLLINTWVTIEIQFLQSS